MASPDDSVHVAPFLHGDDAHSLMSAAQLPPCGPSTLHCAVYCEMKPAAQMPCAYPATHRHLYEWLLTFCPADDESLQAAPFLHGCDEHSFTSVSHRLPLYPAAHVHLKA